MTMERYDKEIALEKAITQLIRSERTPTDNEISQVRGMIRSVVGEDEVDLKALNKVKGSNHPMIQEIIEKL